MIGQDRQWMRLFPYGLAAVSIVLLGFNLLRWHDPVFGWIALCLYIGSLGFFWQDIFSRIYGMRRRDWVTMAFGWFAVVFFTSIASAMAVDWYRLTDLGSVVAYAAVACATILLAYYAKKREKDTGLHLRALRRQASARYRLHFRPVFGRWSFLLPVYAVLYSIAFFFLARAKSQDLLWTPWQTINPVYLSLFFLLTIMLGVFVWSRLRVTTILFLILAHSILLHMYLPLSHALPWGGDVWRHVGVERLLLDDSFHPPVLFGPEMRWRDVFGVSLPEAFLIPHKYAYGQMWGISVLLSRTTEIDLLLLNRWLMPVLWSVAFPLFLFRIGHLLFGSWRYGLVLAALGILPFTWQALGALTLPVSLGFLSFLFVLMLWLQYLRDREAWQGAIALGSGLLLFFSYSLFALVFWSVVAVSALLAHISRHPIRIFGIRAGMMQKIMVAVVLYLSAWIFPFIELVTRLSAVPERYDIGGSMRQMAGQILGLFFAQKIRDHDIQSGNIFFNHTPLASFVSHWVTSWRWHVPLVMAAIVALALIGGILLFRVRTTALWRAIGSLCIIVFGAYGIGWYVLSGDRLLTRRLDPLMALLLLLLALFAAARFYNRRAWRMPRAINSVGAFLIILVFGWFATTAYASGPDLRVMSTRELDVAAYVWEKEFIASKKCILADTWVLLAVEAFSAKTLVGGGFPITYQFGQAERVRLYDSMKQSPTAEALASVQRLTGADHCVIVLPNTISSGAVPLMRALTGKEAEEKAGWFVWFDDQDRTP